MSHDAAHTWKKKLDSGLGFIENAPKSETPKSASSDEIVSKVKEIVKRYARYTLRDKPVLFWYLPIKSLLHSKEYFEC